MIPPKITNLPPAPVRADAPVDFSSKADAMVGALQPFVDEANILAEFVNTRAENAESSASSLAGVQSAVSADRVLSQQAASNAAGSAAAAAVSADTAIAKASAAEGSAVRAEYAAQYVEGMTGGAAPIDNPNFTGVVSINSVPLGYAATAPTVGDGDEVLRVGAGGWLGQGEGLATPYGYPVSIGDVTNQTKTITSTVTDNGVAAYAAGIHFAAGDAWGRLRVNYSGSQAWIQGGSAADGTGWTAELLHTANMLQTTGSSTNLPMSQAATTEAINNAIQNIDDGSAPKPTKNHGNVAVTGSQTVTCDVQESDFHIMSMGTSDGTGTLTIDFSNMPDTLGKHFSWHVRLQRGARKTVAFAQTVNWSGGVAPTFGSTTNSQDLMLFYKVDSETIRGMVIDAW